MKSLIPYIVINNKCEEALHFYVDCFGGQILFMQKYADTDYTVTENFKEKVAHAEFCADGVRFYMSDGFENTATTIGDNVALNVNFDTVKEQRVTFEKLKIDGMVTMYFTETSANSMLATLVDKYGVNWYLNYNQPIEKKQLKPALAYLRLKLQSILKYVKIIRSKK